ncbi:MAG: DUF3644 domain-containing protein [Sphingobacteriaceae bacterium]
MKIIRRGKTKTLIESSIVCALLAVEIYNKPRIPFRVESFITNMIMAWTRLLHAYFNHTIGDKYYYALLPKVVILIMCSIQMGACFKCGDLIEIYPSLRNAPQHKV